MVFQTLVPAFRALQAMQATSVCTVTRNGVVVYSDIPCRKHKERLFSEPPDPQDANMRSMQEWAITFGDVYALRVGDTVSWGAMSVIAGEVNGAGEGDLDIVTRVWATEPKTSTPTFVLTLFRFDPDAPGAPADGFIQVGPFDVQIVYDRNQPAATPLRYSPAAQSEAKGGWIVADLALDIQPGDRFSLGDFACVVDHVLPLQPQRTEARFTMDISGARGFEDG